MKLDTQLIHHTPFNPLDSQPLNTPIFQTSTFYFKDLQEVDDIFSLKKRGFVYTRGGNPTVNLLEKRIATLEHGVDAVAFSSGMGAISSVLFSLLKSNDSIIASDTLYGSSMAFLQNILGKFRVKTHIVNLSQTQQLKTILQQDPHVKAVFFETPANPTLKLIDIQQVSHLSHQHHAQVVVDNTFATPLIQQPLNLGADVVIHSLTKYLNGHGDALGGIAVSKNQSYIDTLKFMYMCDLGSVMDPHSAFLILRGLKTLPLRIKKHQQNAQKIAKFLSQHPRIEKVIFPSLDNFPQQKLYQQQMSGPGSIISFYINKANIQTMETFIKKLQLFKLAVSLGDVDSLIEYPLYMTHRHYLNQPKSATYKDLVKLIRISVGLEHHQDLITDLKNALKE